MNITQCSALVLLAGPVLAVPQLPLSMIHSEAETFGRSVELWSDRVFVGAPFDDTFGVDAGAVYAFDIATGSPMFEVLPEDHLPNHKFGGPMDAAGDFLIVGVPDHDQLGLNAGAAYVFDAQTGQQVHQLFASDGQPTDFFGAAVATDGVHAVVGAFGEDSAGFFGGAAYVYDLATGLERYKLIGLDVGAGDRFGFSVAIDGDRIVIGAESHNASFTGQGAVYVFDLASGQQVSKLLPADPHSFQRFGVTVGLDSQSIVVGANGDNELGSNAGGVYVFDRPSAQQLYKLTEPGGFTGSSFGAGLVVQEGQALIGSGSSLMLSGTAYLFDLATGVAQFEMPAPHSSFGANYSFRFSLDGERAAMGSQIPRLVTIQLALKPIGVRYCSPAQINSTGNPGRMEVLGSAKVTEDLVRLGVRDLPPRQFGYFLTSLSQGFQANFGGSQGDLCLGGSIGGYILQTQQSGRLGTFSIEVDLDQVPVTPTAAMLPGETWHFQAWYRDVGATSNLTDAVSVTFR